MLGNSARKWCSLQAGNGKGYEMLQKLIKKATLKLTLSDYFQQTLGAAETPKYLKESLKPVDPL